MDSLRLIDKALFWVRVRTKQDFIWSEAARFVNAQKKEHIAGSFIIENSSSLK
jgi:hypothetical protein